MICAIADIGGGGGGSDIVLCKRSIYILNCNYIDIYYRYINYCRVNI